jgi:hypothetical protein
MGLWALLQHLFQLEECVPVWDNPPQIMVEGVRERPLKSHLGRAVELKSCPVENRVATRRTGQGRRLRGTGLSVAELCN